MLIVPTSHLKYRNGRAVKKPFPLFQDRDIFKFASKKEFKMLEKNLIEHKNDDDLDTDEDIVNEHIDLCKS